MKDLELSITGLAGVIHDLENGKDAPVLAKCPTDDIPKKDQVVFLTSKQNDSNDIVVGQVVDDVDRDQVVLKGFVIILVKPIRHLLKL